MKNLLNENPDLEIFGRLSESIRFVEKEDIKGRDVLDIGCGFGWYEKYLLANEPKSVSGIEVSERDVQVAKDKITDSRVIFKVGSAVDIPFSVNSFDTVVSWEVIEHIPKQMENKMFLEVSKVLKPGGVFYLSTPYRNLWSMLFDPAWWIIGHRHYSKKYFYELSKRTGFGIEEVYIKGGVWELLSMLNLYFSKWILGRDRIFKEFFVSKVNSEFQKERGFVDLFIKFRKLESVK